MTKEPIMIDDVDVAECEYAEPSYTTPKCAINDWIHCDGQDCHYKQLKRKEQECEEWKNKYYGSTTEVKADLIKQLDQLKAESEELKTEFDNFEEQIKLQGNFIDSFLFATKNSDWLNKSILEDEADAIIEKVESDYVQLENYKQALQEIKKIAEDECKNCTVKLLLEDEINCKRCYKTKILQKYEVIKNANI